MYPDDDKHTSFRTPKMVYYCIVMLFCLKNVEAIYQHAMSAIFCDHLHKIIECYIENIEIKSHCEEDHLYDLRMMFNIIHSHQTVDEPHQIFSMISSDTFFVYVVI